MYSFDSPIDRVISSTAKKSQTYEFDCPACGHTLNKTSTGDYTPRKHKCPSCGSWLTYWVNKSRFRSDKGTVEVIINNDN